MLILLMECLRCRCIHVGMGLITSYRCAFEIIWLVLYMLLSAKNTGTAIMWIIRRFRTQARHVACALMNKPIQRQVYSEMIWACPQYACMTTSTHAHVHIILSSHRDLSTCLLAHLCTPCNTQQDEQIGHHDRIT